MSISIRVIWVLVAIAFGVAEAATLSLTMIWFTIGAFCALGVSYFTDSLAVQIAVFAIVSFVLLFIATKKLIKMDRDKNDTHWASVDTNVDAVIGKKGFVTKKITPEESGIVKVKGEEWSAICVDSESTIEKGKEIVVESIEGVKLVVREK